MQGEHIKWTPEMDALRGTALDTEIADELEIASGSASRRRRILGIQTYWYRGPVRRVEWTPEMDALLGTESDQVIADELGILRETAGRRRRALDIPPWQPKKQNSYVEWTPEIDAKLGKVSDYTLGKELGVSYTTVLRRRRRLGMVSWKEQHRVVPKGVSYLDARRWHQGRRNQRLLELPDTLTFEQWLFACEWFDQRCAYCSAKAFLIMEHLIPVSKEGPRTALNILPACTQCNHSKGPKRAHLWIYEKFGMGEGKGIVDRIVAYLTEVQSLV